MARKLRVQYPGAIYHVMSRGDHLEVTFRDGQDPEPLQVYRWSRYPLYPLPPELRLHGPDLGDRLDARKLHTLAAILTGPTSDATRSRSSPAYHDSFFVTIPPPVAYYFRNLLLTYANTW
jgi:hypothetical protein